MVTDLEVFQEILRHSLIAFNVMYRVSQLPFWGYYRVLGRYHILDGQGLHKVFKNQGTIPLGANIDFNISIYIIIFTVKSVCPSVSQFVC